LELCYKELADKELPDTWFTSYVASKELRLFEVVRHSSFGKPMVIVRMLLIQDNLTLCSRSLDPLSVFDAPPRVSRDSLTDLLNTVAKANVYTGAMSKDILFWHMLGRGSFCQ